MFRPMRRFRQELPKEVCTELLTELPRGILSVYGEDGYPYGIPIDFYYENGKIYFHGAREGHKIDALKKVDRVCFTLMDEGVPAEGKRGLNFRSVICFGRARIMEMDENALVLCRKLGLKYAPGDTAYVEEDVNRNRDHVQMIEMTIDHMSGKLVNES